MIKKLTLTIPILLIVISVFFAFNTQAKELELKYPTLPGGLELNSNTTVPQLIEYLFSFLIFTAGIIAFGAIVAAGFMFITSGANPGLRADAQKRLRNVFLGLLILFSSYLLLRTINPELVDLKLLEDTKLPTVFEQKEIDPKQGIDYNTLRYGGVVVYEDAELAQDKFGSAGAWETVLQDIPNFDNSWLDDGTGRDGWLPSPGENGSEVMSAIKILGKCGVQLHKIQWDTQAKEYEKNGPPIQGPRLYTFIPPPNPTPDTTVTENNVKKLVFTEDEDAGGRNCMGYSTRVYDNVEYNDVYDLGVHAFIMSIPDLSNVDYQDEVGDVEDTISSLSIHPQKGVSFSLSENSIQNQAIVFCDRKNYDDGGEGCISPQKSLESLNFTTRDAEDIDGDGEPDDGKKFYLDNRISSIQFATPYNRQGGVILYQKPGDFEADRQEIVITSLRNIEQGFVINEDKKGELGTDNQSPFGDEGISGIRIIGRYKVTLYSNTDWSIGGSGQWIKFDNTNPSNPTYQLYNDADPKPIPDKRDREGNVIAIKNLGAPEYQFDNNTQSIKLELPVSIIQEQHLLQMNECSDPANDFDLCVRCGANLDPDDLCRI